MRIQELCACGKPIEHLDADEDSADWSCRVPLPDGRLRDMVRESARRYAAVHDCTPDCPPER